MLFRSKADTVLIDPDLWLITKNNSTEKTADINNNTCGSLTNPQPPNTGLGAVDILPNPTTNPFVIYLHDFNDSKATIQIYNSAGQRVYLNNLILTNGASRITIADKNWASGNYILKATVGEKIITKQFIK